MNFKKIIALFLTLAVLFSFSACKNGENAEEPVATTAAAEEVTTEAEEITQAAAKPSDNETQASSEETTAVTDDPSLWNTEQIVEFYKNAAAKTTANAKSYREITLKDVSINNGEYESAINFIMPIMSKLISNNSEEVDGITGGYENLVAADVASAKAYKSGSNTVVEMVMKKQVSGPREDANSGSVGHAITAVGDIGQVVTQLTDLGLPLELSDDDTKIYYTNPKVKAVVDGNGRIISGTWSYTVEISMNNYKAFGKDVKSTSVIMDNTLTVGGGFKK
ncbi:MAG: hypothetical protein IKU08_00950 [Clostridia bacterium]|nr:hypothetical protein [Clostridia bacterium]